MSRGCISLGFRTQDHTLCTPVYTSRTLLPGSSFTSTTASFYAPTRDLNDTLRGLSRDFSRVLLEGVSRGKLASSRTCGGTGISHELFSGVHSSTGCGPDGPATVTFTVTLRLDLRRAGSFLVGTNFTLSHDGGFSIVVRCFVGRNGCGVFRVGRTLFRFRRRLLNT